MDGRRWVRSAKNRAAKEISSGNQGVALIRAAGGLLFQEGPTLRWGTHLSEICGILHLPI